MKKRDIQEILARLSRELQRAEDVDIDARRKMQELHRDIDELDSAGGTEFGSLSDRARELETRFAADHPTLERIARELADAIGKMGI
jgi:hypothetical protein